MVQAISGFEAQKGRKKLALDGFEYWKTVYLGPATPDTTWEQTSLEQRPAQAFLVEQIPESVVEPHFHCVNQFQVVVQGEGTFGRHPIRPGAVHYSGAYTGYGPIVAGKEGLAYFTLRAQCDFGAHYLPQSKSELKDVERQFILADDAHLSSATELSGRSGAVLETIIQPEDTGLAGYLARLGPGAKLTPPSPSSGGGQYWVVVSGELRHGGEELPRLSCLFVAPNDPAPPIEAASRGAEVLVLQYPRSPEPQPRVAGRPTA